MGSTDQERFVILIKETKEQLIQRIENWRIECMIADKEINSLREDIKYLQETNKELEDELANKSYEAFFNSISR